MSEQINIKISRKKRSKYEIIYDMISQCENGAKKTWLMYKANLSYELTNNYINKLKEKEIITEKDDLYYLTDKGKKLLEILKDYVEKKNSLSELEKEIKEYI